MKFGDTQLSRRKVALQEYFLVNTFYLPDNILQVLTLALYVVFVRPCQKSSKVEILEKVKEEDSCLVLNQAESVSAADLISYGGTDNSKNL